MKQFISFLFLLAYALNTSAHPRRPHVLSIDCNKEPSTLFCDKKTTTFTLYNEHIPEGMEISINDPDTIKMISPTIPLKFVIHGFSSSGKNEWVLRLVKSLINYDSPNVITVDWDGDSLSKILKYFKTAEYYTKIVGGDITELINTLENEQNVSPLNIHLLGHSLGAHIAGFVGKNLKNLGRITGLDPAGCQFYEKNLSEKLDASDAVFVDVIHTDGLFFGLLEPSGHIDFYPGGGTAMQPGCFENVCGHGRAYELYIASLDNSNCQMVGVECDTLKENGHFPTSLSRHIASILQCPYKIPKNNSWYSAIKMSVHCKTMAPFYDGMCKDCGRNGNRCAVLGPLAERNPARGSQNLQLFLETSDKPPYCLFYYHISLQVGNPIYAGKERDFRMEIEIIGELGKSVSAWPTKHSKNGKTHYHGKNRKEIVVLEKENVGKIKNVNIYMEKLGMKRFSRQNLFITNITVKLVGEKNRPFTGCPTQEFPREIERNYVANFTFEDCLNSFIHEERVIENPIGGKDEI